MRVLVTGATGFVGGRVTTSLRDRGDEVRALVRTPSDELAARGVDQRVASLTDPREVERLLDGVDAAVHAAAAMGPDLDEARRVNRDGTAALVEALLESGVGHLVHVSTTAVYDRDAAGDTEIGEDDALVDDGSPYAVTKVEAEREVARGAGRGLAALILRPPAVLGAGVTSVWGGRVPRALRDGTHPPRDRESTFVWVHVDDLVAAVLAGLDRGAIGAVNVVGGHTTLGRYLDAAAEAVGSAPPSAVGAERGWRGRMSRDRLEQVLGVRSSRGLDEAMDEITAWWQGA